MKIRAKNREQTVDMTLPVTDMDMQYYMKRIGIEDVMPVCCISEVCLLYTSDAADEL